MSAATVRAAVRDYVDAAGIDGLNRVFLAQPWYIDPDAWDLDNDLGSGAVAYVHLGEQVESRLALPAQTGQKVVTWSVGLVVLYQFLIPSAQLAPVDEDSWVLACDAVLDSLVALIRADQNLGNAITIFQAGENEADLRIGRDLPRKAKGKVLSWNLLEFTVLEIVTA